MAQPCDTDELTGVWCYYDDVVIDEHGGHTTTRIYAEEVEGSNEERYGWKVDSAASVTLKVPWEKRYHFIGELLSGYTAHMNGQTPTENQPWPHAWQKNLCVDTVNIVEGRNLKTDGTSEHANEYETALLAVTYVPRDRRPFTESISRQAEMQTLPGDYFYWLDENGNFFQKMGENELPGRCVYREEITHTYENLAEVPADFSSFINCVNDSAIGTYAVGTLLYTGYTTAQTYKAGAVAGVTNNIQLTAKFIYNSDGWNRFWNQRKNGGDGGYVYLGMGPVISSSAEDSSLSSMDLTPINLYQPYPIETIFNYTPYSAGGE